MSMKYRNPWPAPKRGKARAHLKRPAASTSSKSKAVPYVRSQGVQKKFRKERVLYGVSVQALIASRPLPLIRKLTKDGFLPTWEGTACPHCAVGKLGRLHYFKPKDVWVHKCGRRACKRRVQPHDFHPIFFNGSGSSYTPLGEQAAVLCCAVAGVPVTSTPIILNMDHKPVERIYQNLEHTRCQHVCQKQKKIQFGTTDAWADVEADEVDLGKEVYADGKKAQWEQWGGIVQRGHPETLFLFRLKPKATTVRAPGPGPIRKTDWKPVAWKILKDRSVILHTDGAKAYKMAVPGVLHDNVVHKKKRIMVRGKATWVKPRYTKGWIHTLPGGKKLHVKAGTQIIDRFWGHLRTYLKHASRKVGSMALMKKNRAAQWTYWYSKQNAWVCTATMLKELRS